MTNGDITGSENIVDEAADVEKRLAHIRELITLAEAKEAAKDTDGSNESQVTQEEKVGRDVGNVLSEVPIYFLFGGGGGGRGVSVKFNGIFALLCSVTKI